MNLIDGRRLAAQLCETVASGVRDLVEEGVTPGLAVVLVGSDPASEVYVRRKIVQASGIRIVSRLYRLDESAPHSPRLVRGDWVKPGAVVIDVGINRVTQQDGTSRIVGDAATEELSHALAVTPTPGGVGPMTVACLMANTLNAAKRLRR